MSARRVPVVSTIIVIAAAATMIALGAWQLGRKAEKEALIERYEANSQLPPIGAFEPFPAEVTIHGPASDRPRPWSVQHAEDALFRRVTMNCLEPRDPRAVAGRNAQGQPGYVHMYDCRRYSMGFMNGDRFELHVYATIGWSRGPQPPEWRGGTVSGILAPAGDDYKVVVDEPLAGLEPLAPPDPSDLPNNHLAYAFQWFFFALTALAIYWLALRRKWRDG